MSNVIKLMGSRKQQLELIRDQASGFLARLDAGATPEEIAGIELWLAQSPAHRKVFMELAAMWDELDVIAGLSSVVPLEEYSPVQPRSWSSWPLAAACTILLAVTLGWYFRGALGLNEQPSGLADVVVYEYHNTAVGEQSTLTLPDGSEVILNTNTEIEIAFSGAVRNVFLNRGEAFFEVTKNPLRPFRVYAGNRMVEAVGTAFTVQHSDAENIEVVVKEGKVNFLKLNHLQAPATVQADLDTMLTHEDSISLVAGERAAALSDARSSVQKQQIQADEIEVRLAWTHGMLLFQGDTLETMLQEVSRYTTIRLEAVDSIREIAVEGYFRAGDIDGLLLALEKNFQIEAIKVSENHILLYGGNNANNK